MTPKERLDWFWAIGELPGTILDDLNDRKRKIPGRPRRRHAKRLRLGSRKQKKETSKHNEA